MSVLPVPQPSKIDPAKEFEAKILARLKDDIRDLLPDEILASLVQRAVDETFFKDRVMPNSSGWDKTTKPSLFVESVANEASPMIKAAVEKFVADRHDVIQKAIDAFLTEERLSIYVAEALAGQLAMTFRTFLNEIPERIKRGY